MTETKSAAYARFRPSWRSFVPYYFGVLLFVVGPMVNPEAPISPDLSRLLATLCLAVILVVRFTRSYSLTDSTLSVEKTFPAKQSLNCAIKDITRIEIRRGAVQRMAGVGHIHVYTNEPTKPLLTMFGVEEPLKFRELLISLGASHREGQGVWRS